jgi:hypothetical protein
VDKAKRQSLIQTLLDVVAPVAPPLPHTPAEDEFLLTEGVLPETPPPPPPIVPPPPDLWMLGTPTYQRRIVFTESIGARFGDTRLTARFLLDGWCQSPAGFRWTLDPAAPGIVEPSERARDLLAPCLVRTRVGLCKLAVAEHAGDVEAAIIQAIDEHLTQMGLDRFIPEPAEA